MYVVENCNVGMKFGFGTIRKIKLINEGLMLGYLEDVKV